MITDFQCNTVYLSSLLQKECPKTYLHLIRALQKHNIEYKDLTGTNAIWCRDYMPIQISENAFCGFTYDPDYLHNSEDLLATRTDGNIICRRLGFNVKEPPIHLVLDGGNVIRCDNKIIMIEKVFNENRHPKKILQKIIEEHFMAELIVLPWDEIEFYGHADGIVRYIGNNRVLITNYDKFDKHFTNKVINTLRQHFSEVIKLEYNIKRQHKHNWAYINWLQTNKALFLPSFGYPEDEQALEQITSLMPTYKGYTEMIDARDLIRYEGGLNCASWTIMS